MKVLDRPEAPGLPPRLAGLIDRAGLAALRGQDPAGRRRTLLIAAVLLAAPLLAWHPSRQVVALVYLALGSWVLFRHPRAILPTLLLAGALVPLKIGTGTGSSINVAMMVVGGFMVVQIPRLLLRQELRPRPSVANAPWLALVVLAGFSIVAGAARWNPWVNTKENFLVVQLAQWSLYLLPAGAYLITGVHLHRRAELERLFKLLYVLAACRILGWLALDPYLVRWGILTGPVLFMWLASACAAAALFLPGWSRGRRALAAATATAVFLFPYAYGRDWKSGWLPTLVALIAVASLWLWRRSRRAVMAIYLVVLVLGPAAYLLLRGLAADDAWSLDTRLIALRGLAQLLEGRWILGLGLAAYWHYWRDVMGQMSYIDPDTGYFHYTFAPTVNMHNNYLDVLGQMGILGLLVFIWLLAALAIQAFRSFRAEAPGFGQAYAAACVGGIAGMIVAGLLGDWVIPFVYNIGLNGFRDSFLAWLLLGGLTLLDATRGQEEAPTATSAPAPALPLPHPPAPPRAPA